MVPPGLTYGVTWRPHHHGYRSETFDDLERAYAFFAGKLHAYDGTGTQRNIYVTLWIEQMHTEVLYGQKIPCFRCDGDLRCAVDDGLLRRAFEEWRDGIDARGRALAERERERYPEYVTMFLQERYPAKSGRAARKHTPVDAGLGRGIDRALGRR
jgi:hypothetical protein